MTDLVSAADFIQADRVLRLVTPLGADQLLPERVTILEGVNHLFEIRIAARAKPEAVKPEDLIGRLVDVSLEVSRENGVRRPFNGLVTNLNEGPPITRGLRAYALVVRPQMWLLSRRSDCRIWMDKTAIDVVETLFAEHGIPRPMCPHRLAAPPQHYSVQWNETDLDYLLRRFEEDGLFYWFSHKDGSHTLHVADTRTAGSGHLPRRKATAASGWRRGRRSQSHHRLAATVFLCAGQRAGADWNFETPNLVPRR